MLLPISITRNDMRNVLIKLQALQSRNIRSNFYCNISHQRPTAAFPGKSTFFRLNLPKLHACQARHLQYSYQTFHPEQIPHPTALRNCHAGWLLPHSAIAKDLDFRSWKFFLNSEHLLPFMWQVVNRIEIQ